MKKNLHKRVTASAIIAGAAIASGALFFPACNRPGNLYGPPPNIQTKDYDPNDNVNEDVYGPPPMEEEEDYELDTETDEFDPSQNLTPTLYGPPPAKDSTK